MDSSNEGFGFPPQNWLRDLLAQQGFEVCALLDISPSHPSYQDFLRGEMRHFENWISKQFNADMDFLKNHSEARTDPQRILLGAQTAVVCLVPYATGARVRGAQRFPSETVPSDAHPNALARGVRLARYARGKDYHKVIKKRLDAVGAGIADVAPEVQFRTVCDKIPFFDRAHAKRAGLAFTGKNTCAIRPGMGSYFFVATLLVTTPVHQLAATARPQPSPLLTLDCGNCRRCLDACPTQALVAPHVLDAKRCLSWETIENRGPLSPQAEHLASERMFGCDICQEVCPYNWTTQDLRALPELALTHPPFWKVGPEEVAQMSGVEWELWFGGTAATRAKKEGWIRNAKAALGSKKSTT